MDRRLGVSARDRMLAPQVATIIPRRRCISPRRTDACSSSSRFADTSRVNVVLDHLLERIRCATRRRAIFRFASRSTAICC